MPSGVLAVIIFWATVAPAMLLAFVGKFLVRKISRRPAQLLGLAILFLPLAGLLRCATNPDFIALTQPASLLALVLCPIGAGMIFDRKLPRAPLDLASPHP